MQQEIEQPVQEELKMFETTQKAHPDQWIVNWIQRAVSTTTEEENAKLISTLTTFTAENLLGLLKTYYNVAPETIDPQLRNELIAYIKIISLEEMFPLEESFRQRALSFLIKDARMPLDSVAEQLFPEFLIKTTQGPICLILKPFPTLEDKEQIQRLSLRTTSPLMTLILWSAV